MPLTRRTLLAASAAGSALTTMAGCVATRVSGQATGTASPPARQLLVVVRTGSFAANNTASHLGQKNLDNLVPQLVARLPVVFSNNGLPSRAVAAQPGDPLRPAAGERVLIVVPESATYSSKSGQELFLAAQLLSADAPYVPVWRARIRMGTLGFGQFDAKVANDIALQMLEQLRGDKLAAVTDGPLRAE